MSEIISLDPAREVPMQARINRRNDFTLEFVDNDSVDYDISGFTWEFFVKENPGARTKMISLTLGNGLSIPIYSDNVLNGTISVAQSQIEEGQYYYELVRTDLPATWLNGIITFSYGSLDSE